MTTPPNAYGRRKLPYPYSYLTEQPHTSTLNIMGQPAKNQAGTQFYLLEMTDAQVLQFSSALTAGADLIYPDTQIDVITPWLNARAMDICAAIADCIANNVDVQNAITEYLQDSGNIPTGTSESPPATDEGVLTGLPCSQDDLYGQIVAIVDFVQEVAKDVVEVVAGAANDQLAIARLVDIIPILGDLPIVDDLSEIAEWITNAGPLSYDAGWTTTVRQDIICAMWEAACSDCDLTTTDIVEAYRTGGGFTFNVNDVYHIMIGVIIGTTGDKAFAVGVNAAVAYALSIGQDVLGLVGLPGLRTIAATGTPSGDHALFCNPCAGTWCYEFDFTNGLVQAGVTFTIIRGQLVGGVIEETGGNDSIAIQADFGQVVEFDQVEFTILGMSGSNPAITVYECSSLPCANFERTLLSSPVAAGTYTIPVQPPYNRQVVVLESDGSEGGGSGTNDGISAITLRGTGTNPFGTNNC